MAVAEEQGRTIDKSPPPWTRPSLPIGFPLDAQQEFGAAFDGLYDRVESAGQGGDIAAAEGLEPGGRWNNLITAVATYISGAELGLMSARDFIDYQDSGVNWSVTEGFGATIAAAGAGTCASCSIARCAGSTTAGSD